MDPSPWEPSISINERERLCCEPCNYEGGIRVPGIFHWPGHIPESGVEERPAGLVDLLPTICGLVGIDPPGGVHLDGSDISPLLWGKAEKFKRQQPLFWLLPGSGPTIALREENYALVAFRDYEFPKDHARLNSLKREIAALLKERGTYKEETRGSTFDKMMFEDFKDRDAEKLRGQFIMLNMFSERYIPAIKKGGYTRFDRQLLGKLSSCAWLRAIG